MDYQSYDAYMRNTLGFSGSNCSNPCMMPYQNMYVSPMCPGQCNDLERMYPDSYRVVYPMVVSACNTVNMPITEDMLDNMTDDIYDRAMADGRISVDINIETRDDEGRQMGRRPRPRRNRFFRDLIRILLLRELLGRRQRFPVL